MDTEEWMRLSAMEHATGDWDSFFTQNQWNMYCYKPISGQVDGAQVGLEHHAGQRHAKLAGRRQPTVQLWLE